MAYFPSDMPHAEPDFNDRPFWAACDEGVLRFQVCVDCGTPRHPPGPLCPKCLSSRVDWREAPADARLFSYTVVHHASHPAVKSRLPYVVALVEFPSMPGVRLVSNLTDLDPEDVRIDMPLALWWDDIGDGHRVPRFRALAKAA